MAKTAEPKPLANLSSGPVGQDGMRRIRMAKGSDDDVSRLAGYEERGYEIKENKYSYELSIPQADFEEMERRRQAQDISDLRQPPPKTAEMDVAVDKTFAPQSIDALLSGNAEGDNDGDPSV